MSKNSQSQNFPRSIKHQIESDSDSIGSLEEEKYSSKDEQPGAKLKDNNGPSSDFKAIKEMTISMIGS